METRVIEETRAKVIRPRLQTAGTLVITGLAVEVLSLFWIHPLAFMGFLVIGCGFLGLGILLFLWTLVTA